MAITPQECSRLHPQDKIEADKWEQEIDVYLSAHFNDGLALYVRTGGRHRNVVTEIARRYEASGWTVLPEYEERDGDLLKFIPKPDGWK